MDPAKDRCFNVFLLLLEAKTGAVNGLALETISAVNPLIVIAIIPSASMDSAIDLAATPRCCQSVLEINFFSYPKVLYFSVLKAIRDINSTHSTGYLPIVVSPESITASVPS